MFSIAGTITHSEGTKPRWSVSHALIDLATARTTAGSSEQIPSQPHPSFFVFLLLIAAWCLGASIPSDEV